MRHSIWRKPPLPRQRPLRMRNATLFVQPTQAQNLDGALFQKAPTFFTGQFSQTIHGLLGTTGYLYGVNASGQGAFTLDHDSFDITGDLQIIVGVAFNHITGKATIDNLITKGNPGTPGGGSWVFRKQGASRTMNFSWRDTGGTVASISFASAVPNVIGQFRWYKLEFDEATATGELFTSDEDPSTDVDSISWTSLTTSSDAVDTDFAPGDANVWVGNRSDNINEYLDGKLYYADVRNGIGGPIITQADFRQKGPSHQYLRLPGSSADVTTPDHASLDITGDLDVRLLVAPDDWSATADQTLLAKWEADNGTSASWRFTVRSTGRLEFTFWDSVTGGIREQVAVGSLSGFSHGSLRWLRAVLDADNGSSQYAVRFYTSSDPITIDPDLVTWTQFESDLVGSSVANLNTSDAQLTLGANGVTAEPFIGEVYYAEVRNGIDGTIVANADFRSEYQRTSSTTFVDDTGKTWTLNSTAAFARPHNDFVDSTGKPWTVIDSPGNWILPLSVPPTFFAGKISHQLTGNVTGYVRLVDQTGNRVSTPDHADFAISSAIDVRALLFRVDWADGSLRRIVGQRTGSTNRSWSFYMDGVGELGFNWSEFGTGDAGDGGFQESSLNLSTQADNSWLWVRTTFLGNNGSGSYEVKFYTSSDPITTDPASVTWAQFGSTRTAATVEALFNSTADVVIGAIDDGSHMIGRIGYVEIRNGIDGTIVASPDFRDRDQFVSNTSLTDPQGKTWTINSPSFWHLPIFKKPTFFTGSLTAAAGEQTLSGVLFSKAPTFFTGKVSHQLLGVLFSKAKTTFVGAVTSRYTVSGVLFTKAKTTFVGTVTTTRTLTGVLFTKAPTFFAARAQRVLSGVLFTKAKTTFVGTVTTTRTVSGVLFTKAPTFFTGRVQRQLSGVLFTKTKTTFVGTITSRFTLSGVLFTKAKTTFVGKVSHQLRGALFSKAPTFFTATVQRGAVTLSGVLFQKAPTFFAARAQRVLSGQLFTKTKTTFVGTVTTTYTVSGVLFTKAPTFFIAKIQRTLLGVLFVKAPTFFTGTVTTTYTLSGVLFSKAPTFFIGTLSITQTLAGVLFSKAPTFFVGTLSVEAVTLSGILFQKAPNFFQGNIQRRVLGVVFTKAPTFFQGSIATTYTISGVLFSKAPTFFQGSLQQVLSGVLFSKAPTFFIGNIQRALSGVLFQKAPTFFIGSVQNVLSGVLFSKAPTFFTGSINTGAVTISGVLFQKAADFFVGEVQIAGVIAGALFEKAPTFFTATISPQAVTISGVLFQKAPTFFVGAVHHQLLGVLFTKSTTFFQGSITSTYTLTGALFSKAPTFFVGTLHHQLLGVLFSKAPTFFQGVISPQAVTTTGVLFQKVTTFFQGSVTTAGDLTGILFSKSPTFFVGDIQQRLPGVFFEKTPTFFVGTLNSVYTLTGVLFQTAPGFFVGLVTQAFMIEGNLFQKAPVFFAGTMTSQRTIVGVLFSKSPTFFFGTLNFFVSNTFIRLRTVVPLNDVTSIKDPYRLVT